MLYVLVVDLLESVGEKVDDVFGGEAPVQAVGVGEQVALQVGGIESMLTGHLRIVGQSAEPVGRDARFPLKQHGHLPDGHALGDGDHMGGDLPFGQAVEDVQGAGVGGEGVFPGLKHIFYAEQF